MLESKQQMYFWNLKYEEDFKRTFQVEQLSLTTVKEVGVFSTEINQKDKSEAVMEQYKKEFIEFMIDCNVLKFGGLCDKKWKKDSIFC